MKSKKLFSIALAAIVSTTSINVPLPGGVETVSAATYEKSAPVNIIESIDAPDINSEVFTFDWDQTDDRANSIYKVQFVVDSLEYVHIKIHSTVSSSNTSSLGCLDTITLTSASGNIISTLAGNLYSGKTLDYYYILEKGTYYITFNGLEEKEGYGKSSKGSVTTTIEAEKVSRTGDVAGLKKSAISLTSGTTSYGYVSTTVKEQYFKLELDKKSDVTFTLSTTNTPSTFSKNLNYKLYAEDGNDYSSEIALDTIEKYSHKQCSLGSGFFYQMPDVGTVSTTLPAGTYYLQFTADGDKDASEIAVKTTVNAIAPPATASKKTISKLKVTAKKKQKKVTVKTIASATVKVKIGSKTYTGKSNKKGTATIKTAKLKKGAKVKVTVSKSGYKTKSKTVKVK